MVCGCFLEARARGIIGAPVAQERDLFANETGSPFDNRFYVTGPNRHTSDNI